ncbi:MAG TPA: hypothetical protein VF116_01855 [Ktedonobacterales bacterium]
MAEEHHPPGLEPDGETAPQQTPVSLRDIAPARWALLGLNLVLFVVCVLLMATSPLVPWYRAPNAGAAPLLPTASATIFYMGPATSTPPPAATATHTPKPTRTPRGSAPTSTPTAPPPTATATPTPLGPPTPTFTPIAPTPTNTPCAVCQ